MMVAWTAMVTRWKVMEMKAPLQKHNRQGLETDWRREEVSKNMTLGCSDWGLEVVAS